MMMLKKIALWTIVLLLPTFLLAWVIKSGFTKTDKAALSKQKEDAWINEKWASMTENERIGQLFMVAAYPNKGAEDEAIVKELIEKYHVGGLIMFYSGPAKAASLINYYQSLSKKVPLMVSVDGEWGLNMRMDSVMAFPRQILMGAIQDNRLIYDFGKEVARQCRRVGIHINFAPVVDVNNNPSNPVIGDRSFGENKENVTAKAFQYMMGMQDNEIMACAKHFPGHGDTNVDSHYDLPVINHNTQRLDSLELYPFRNLIQQGIQSVMVAHLHIPAIDATKNLPTTLSKPAITSLLKEQMGFEGLTFTDAMMMKGVTKHFQAGEAEIRALKAGIDVVLMPDSAMLSISRVKKAIAAGELNWTDLEKSIKKILRAKYRLGLHDYKPVSLQRVLADINNPTAHALYEKLIESALTLTSNPNDLLPLKNISGKKIATLSIGYSAKTPFQAELEKYGLDKHYQASSVIQPYSQTQLMNSLKGQDVVIIGLHRVGRYPQTDYDISPSARKFINDLSKQTKVILTVFGNPYALRFFDEMPYVACTYVNDDAAERKAAQAIMGALPFSGKLPVSCGKLKYGMGVKTESYRLPYSEKAENLGLNQSILNKIDAVANEAITKGAVPGCQVMVLKNGKIAFHRAYGHTNTDKKQKVSLTDLYDLASVTKVAAATASVMKLYEEGKIDIEDKVSKYINELKGTNKENMTIKQMLLHESGMKAWFPFYIKTLDEKKRPDKNHYRSSPDAAFSYRVAEGIYISKAKQDSLLWQTIFDSEIDTVGNYRYSDNGFILITRLVERVSGKTLDKFADDNFYAPMGLENIMYNPLLNGIPKNRIIPTEEDKYFRYQRIQGDVHDMGSAMLGGVSGHAGLFAQASDIAAMFQMFLNGGTFMGKRYLKAETVEFFTSRYSMRSRRGLGFDRREGTGQNTVNVAAKASDNTFGHTGFTGISVWADPDNDLLYVFLSNRTYPIAENNKIINMNIRTRIHDIIYEAFTAPVKSNKERVIER
jgi:beta-glucosidase-like glycosyl hydrolase/CubicO group peptidase (beta-lactamase class C family)